MHIKPLGLLKALSLLILIMAAHPVSSMAGESGYDKGFSLYFDQDLLAFDYNEDRDYTFGIAVEFFWQKKSEGLYPVDKPVLWLGKKFGVFDENAKTVRSFMLGVIAYTPDDLRNPNPIDDDRPYAGLTFISNKHVYESKDYESRQFAIGIEMRLGILGTDLPGDIQAEAHRLYRNGRPGSDDPADPKGWSNQVSDKGEPTFGLRIAYSELVQPLSGKYHDVAYTADASIGYQTNVSLGFSARLGVIKSKPWTLPYDPVNRGNFLPSLSTPEAYLWLAYRARLIGYDALLQGQFSDNDVEYGSGDVRNVVHDAGTGLTLNYKNIELTFAINGKTSELNAQAADRNHVWGGAYIRFRL